MKKFIILLIGFCVLILGWFLYSEIYTAVAQKANFEVKQGESVSQLAMRLENEGVIRSASFFKLFLRVKGLDKKINYGEFTVAGPITLARVAEVLSQPGLNEKVITIIPGWNLRQVTKYLTDEGFADSAQLDSDWEGYLAPNTYRVYKNANLSDIINKLKAARVEEFKQIDAKLWGSSDLTERQVLTLASIVEKEANTAEDMAIVADIFLRRLEENWALQSCATVNYITGKNDPGVSAVDKKIDSPYNTYKYPGLPPGPICNPSLDAIKAVLESKKNDYNYFMTGSDGMMRYATTLEEHNANVTKYLK